MRYASSPSIDTYCRAPKASFDLAEDFDFEPWKLNTSAKFQAALDHLRREASVPALAVGVVSIDSPPKVHVIGDRKIDCKSPVTRADCFGIGNSNIFATTLLAILIDQGLFRWEETIPELFPWFAKRIHPFHHQTTLSMLGAHCTGLGRTVHIAENGDLFRYLRQVDGTKGRRAVVLSYITRPPDREPGTAYNWSFANPVLIAYAIEERISKSLESLVKALIFDPLEMYWSGFGRLDAERNASLPDKPSQPWGHKGATKTPLSPADVRLLQPPALFASVGIYCSAPDFASFVDMHLRAVMGLPRQLLQSPSVEHMYSRFSGTDSTHGSWTIASREWAQGEALMNAGISDGFGFSCWLAPRIGKAFFAFANVDDEEGSKITDQAVVLAIRHAVES